MNMPFFSIIIPTYNRKLFLSKTINSVLNQNFKDFEIILIDDGSTDGTQDFINQEFRHKLQYYFQKNKERGAARNLGAQKAKGKYVYFLDSDDLIYPNHLKEAFQFIKKNQPDWFFQEYEILNGSKKNTVKYNRTNPIKTLVSKGNFLSCHGIFIKKVIFLQNSFDENRELAGSEDYELWLRMAARYHLMINPIITSALIEHDDRSVFNFSIDKLIKRKELFLKSLRNDEVVIKKFGSDFNKIEANSFSYISLHAAMIKEKSIASYYFKKSIQKDFTSIFNRRTLAIFKYLLK